MKRNTKFFVGIIGYILLSTGCKREKLDQPRENGQVQLVNTDQATIMGQQMRNPFTIENMRQALTNILARKNQNTSKENYNPDQIQPTHWYIRFNPKTVDDVIALDTSGYELEDIPFDKEIAQPGDYYHDPSIPQDQITYLYTVVPVGTLLPINIPYTKLSDLYLFDEDAGDETDEIDDPWDPKPPYCNNIIGEENLCPPKANNNIQKSTKQLINAGISPIELYNEAMKISGNEEELGDNNDNLFGKRYYPKGKILVQDNDAAINIPLKGVLVRARRWFKLATTYTDANGNFSFNTGYRQKVLIINKMKNGSGIVRGINGVLKVWQYIFPVKKTVGQYSKSSMENINYTYAYNATPKTNQAMQWVAATAMNALWDQYNFCQQNQLPNPPLNLNIWVSAVVTSDASTPMLRRIANTSLISNGIDLFLLGWQAELALLKKVVQNYLPDITCRYEDKSNFTKRSADLNNTFYHELAHSIHYGQVGNNYWVAYIAYIINIFLQKDPNMPSYGYKNMPGAERIATAEAWGYCIGNMFTETKYKNLNVNTVSDKQRNQLENQIPDDNIDVVFYTNQSSGWIPFGMLYDMTDIGEQGFTGVIDNVNQYNINKIFKCYLPNVLTVQGLKQEILNKNNNLQSAEMNPLVTSYKY